MSSSTSTFKLRLPATSANLGSGFDAAAVALDFFLEIEARPADIFSIESSGLDSEQCSTIKDNLILGVYQKVLAENGKALRPLALKMHNQIPLGMGCGSSAAGRLAAISLAAHYGELNWEPWQILEEACALEGHPDNASACWLGGFVAAANEGRKVHVARVIPPAPWCVVVVLPPESLPTSKARAVLPLSYSSADVVSTIQAVSMLGLAFAQSRGDLLRVAMMDRIHQPYRFEMCPMLPRLLPLAGTAGVLGVGLSGAGPAVLAVVDSESNLPQVFQAIEDSLAGLPRPKMIAGRFEENGAEQSFLQTA